MPPTSSDTESAQCLHVIPATWNSLRTDVRTDMHASSDGEPALIFANDGGARCARVLEPVRCVTAPHGGSPAKRRAMWWSSWVTLRSRLRGVSGRRGERRAG